jgi:hypothetical protein
MNEIHVKTDSVKCRLEFSKNPTARELNDVLKSILHLIGMKDCNVDVYVEEDLEELDDSVAEEMNSNEQ